MYRTKYLVFWNPYEEAIEYSKADLFTDLFGKFQNVVTIDLKNNKDPRSRRLLREADLVVLFIKQSISCLDTYFERDLIRKENVIFVISDYIYDGIEDWELKLEQYRIPKEQLFFLPFNSRLPFVKEQGCLDRYLQGVCMDYPYESAMGFFPCYQKIREKIFQSLTCC